MNKPVSFSIYDKSIDIVSFLNTVDGLTYSHKPVEMAFDSVLDAPKLVELFLSFSSAVGVSLFASWLYERMKSGTGNTKKIDKHVTINGNKISGENITVIQIVNVINVGIDNSNDTKHGRLG
ncbi:MAG: hypothetical protein NT086_05805 [Proteobacteria bacterium]|nr:hypothetical protein [Pseudomonadota bacterium]